MKSIQLCLYSIFFFIISTAVLSGQSYHPMPSSAAQWDVTRCWSFYPGGWHDEYSIQQVDADTLINGKVYNKLNIVIHHLPGTEHDSVYTHFLGGMREANRQVFFISEYLCLDTIERMLYDFNEADTGDTIYTQILTHDLTQFIPHIVTAIDSVWVGDDYHRRIHLRDENDFFSETWTEGVGSNWGLVYASYWVLTDNSYDLNCFYDGSQLEYTNPDPTYSFCTFPLPFIECELTTSVPSFDPDEMFSIYPNPTYNHLLIVSSIKAGYVHIYNSYGQKVMSGKASGEIQTGQLAPGIYFIQLRDSEGIKGIEKFIKI